MKKLKNLSEKQEKLEEKEISIESLKDNNVIKDVSEKIQLSVTQSIITAQLLKKIKKKFTTIESFYEYKEMSEDKEKKRIMEVKDYNTEQFSNLREILFISDDNYLNSILSGDFELKSASEEKSSKF
jgi:hypothetical protein